VSTFVKVMPKKPWPLFFRTRCIWDLLQMINVIYYLMIHLLLKKE